jgi:hypothetical protein
LAFLAIAPINFSVTWIYGTAILRRRLFQKLSAVLSLARRYRFRWMLVASAAVQIAEHAADNIVRHTQGKSLKPFAYKNPSSQESRLPRTPVARSRQT